MTMQRVRTLSAQGAIRQAGDALKTPSGGVVIPHGLVRPCQRMSEVLDAPDCAPLGVARE
jgi:hypothetical protein